MGKDHRSCRWSHTTLLQVSSHLIAPSSSGLLPQDAPILNVGRHPGLGWDSTAAAPEVLNSTVSVSEGHKAMVVFVLQSITRAQLWGTHVSFSRVVPLVQTIYV